MPPRPLLFAAPAAALPTCEPNLMPFHISYDGPAPIATYFRPKPFVSELNVAITQPPSSPQDASNAPPDASLHAISSTQDVEMRFAEVGGSDANADASSVLVPVSLKDRVQHAKRRLIATFRGRTMHGHEILLPDGYVGLVLETDEKPRPPTKKASGHAAPRRGRGRGNAARFDEDDEDEGMIDEEEPLAPRVLRPTAQFSSLMVWNPDFPLDEGRDEYVRSMTEWVHLAALINQTDDAPISSSA